MRKTSERRSELSLKVRTMNWYMNMALNETIAQFTDGIRLRKFTDELAKLQPIHPELQRYFSRTFHDQLEDYQRKITE